MKNIVRVDSSKRFTISFEFYKENFIESFDVPAVTFVTQYSN
jgi:hypothetical protein